MLAETRSNSGIQLTALPSELIYQVALHLPPRDILQLLLTSKHFGYHGALLEALYKDPFTETLLPDAYKLVYDFEKACPLFLARIPKLLSSLAKTNVTGRTNGQCVTAMTLSAVLQPDEFLELIHHCPNARSLDITLWSASIETESSVELVHKIATEATTGDNPEWVLLAGPPPQDDADLYECYLDELEAFRLEDEARGLISHSRGSSAGWNELLEVSRTFLRPLRFLKVRPYLLTQLHMDNLWDPFLDGAGYLKDTYACLRDIHSGEFGIELASQRFHRLIMGAKSLESLELHGQQRWALPECTESVKKTLAQSLGRKTNSLRRLNLVGIHGLVRNLKGFLAPLRVSQSLETIGISINEDLLFLDGFLPDLEIWEDDEGGDETEDEADTDKSVVFGTDRTSLAYLRTLCDLLAEKRWEIQFTDDPEDFPIPPDFLMEQSQPPTMCLSDLDGPEMAEMFARMAEQLAETSVDDIGDPDPEMLISEQSVERLQRIGFLHETKGWEPRFTWGEHMRPSCFAGEGYYSPMNGLHNDLKDIEVLACLPKTERDSRLAKTRQFFQQLKSMGMSIKLLLPADKFTGLFFQPHCGGGDGWFLSEIGDLVDDLRVEWQLNDWEIRFGRGFLIPQVRDLIDEGDEVGWGPTGLTNEKEEWVQFDGDFDEVDAAILRAEAVFMQPFWPSLKKDFPNLRRLKVVIPKPLYPSTDQAFVNSVLPGTTWTVRREPDVEGQANTFIIRQFLRIDDPDSEPVMQVSPTTYHCEALDIVPMTDGSHIFQIIEDQLIWALKKAKWLNEDGTPNENRRAKYDYRKWYQEEGWTGRPWSSDELAQMAEPDRALPPPEE